MGMNEYILKYIIYKARPESRLRFHVKDLAQIVSK